VRDPRTRIAVWAIAIGFLCGFFYVPSPLEALYHLTRDTIRMQPADGETVLIMIDDESLSELGVSDPLRSDDARLVDALFNAGAERVVFDRAYSDASSPAEDAKLLAALERHRGSVFIGSTPEISSGFGTTAQLLTHPRFRGQAPMVSMEGHQRVFGLSWNLPTSSVILDEKRPSISAVLAGFEDRDLVYRPDFSIDFNTIPMIRYVDALKGRVSPETFAGRDVIIAPANRSSPDLYFMPTRGVIAGAQIHAVGAQTLRSGIPRNFGWLPAFLFAAGFVLYQSRQRMPSMRAAALAGAGVLAIQAGLDLVLVTVDVFSGLIALAIGAVRLRNYARSTYRGETGMVRMESFHAQRFAPECDVIALKIRNFATISACLSPQEIDTLLVKTQEMLRTSEANSQFAFDKDTVVWLREKLCESDRDGHLRGIHALFRTSITIGSQAPDVATALGLDVNYQLSLRERTENAMQSAEDAAHHGQLFQISEADQAEDRSWRVQFLSELERAIANEEVDVRFQPKVRLANGVIVGAEALLRWNHPTRGAIEPAQIIAYAEEHNRIDIITKFVLDRALCDAKRALAVDKDFKVAVNVSALDLRDPHFPEHVAHLLTQHAYPPANLLLEITETAPIENDRNATLVLSQLNQMGIGLSVDDFGTGHASLHYLRQIPSCEVKIDRSFVANIEHSAEDRALVKTAIEMIHSLSRIAVAEGVETEAVARLLIEMGCDTAQGFYFAKAKTMSDLLTELHERALAA
jgi:EAL domain-containing protein (putative c-di-GMP-specific phosphodiesterase class I)/CHASE2 domain-containing sensor protein